MLIARYYTYWCIEHILFLGTEIFRILIGTVLYLNKVLIHAGGSHLYSLSPALDQTEKLFHHAWEDACLSIIV